MNVAVFTPYSGLSDPGSAINLLMAYLHHRGFSVTQIICNGSYSICDRNSGPDDVRSVTTCLRCCSQQRQIAEILSVKTIDLGTFLNSKLYTEIGRQFANLDSQALLTTEYRGKRTVDLCIPTFEKRFGHCPPDLEKPIELAILRELLTATARAQSAIDALLSAGSYDSLLVGGAGDYLTNAVRHEAQQRQTRMLIANNDKERGYFVMTESPTSQALDLELNINLSKLAAESPEQWPPYLIAGLEQITHFLRS